MREISLVEIAESAIPACCKCGTTYAREKANVKISRSQAGRRRSSKSLRGLQHVVKSISGGALVLLVFHTSAGQSVIVTNITAGYVHSLFLKSDGSLWAMGDNYSGQLGNGANGIYNDVNKPEKIVCSGVVAVAGGYFHSLFIKSDGSLWAMGQNGSGQLGDGRPSPRGQGGPSANTNQPEQIVSSGVVAVAAGSDHSLFIKSDGSLWGMGNNRLGQLGDGTHNNTNLPKQIVSNGVTAIACGQFYSLFLKSDGSLWAMGANNQGQLGDGTFHDANRPKQIISHGVVAIAAKDDHSLFLKSDGSLWGMGNNYSGQLGNGTDGIYNYVNRPEKTVSSGVVAIAAGAFSSLFLKSDGSLWAMGGNSFGELGDGTFSKTNRPKQIISNGVVAIAGGGPYNLFLKSNGSLWAMGYNNHGQLGNGFTNSTSSLPEQIFPSPRPVLISNVSFQSNLQFNATCQFGGRFYLLSSSSLTQPLSEWTPVWTNSVMSRGANNFSATLTNAVSSTAAGHFYILQSDERGEPR